VIDVCRDRRVISTAHLELLEAGALFDYGLTGVEHVTSLGPSLLPQVERERYRQAVLAENAARSDGRYRVFAVSTWTDLMHAPSGRASAGAGRSSTRRWPCSSGAPA
jgi:hypothetical protein